MSYEAYEVSVDSDGATFWYQKGKLHRLDGPAVEYASGTKCWYQKGKYHRLDGPAIEYASGTKSWYIEGVEYTEEEFNKKTNLVCNKIVTIDGIEYELKERK